MQTPSLFIGLLGPRIMGFLRDIKLVTGLGNLPLTPPLGFQAENGPKYLVFPSEVITSQTESRPSKVRPPLSSPAGELPDHLPVCFHVISGDAQTTRLVHTFTILIPRSKV